MKKDTDAFGNQRQIINTNEVEYYPYDFGGPVSDGVYQHDLSYNRDSGHGMYLIRILHRGCLVVPPPPLDHPLAVRLAMDSVCGREDTETTLLIGRHASGEEQRGQKRQN